MCARDHTRRQVDKLIEIRPARSLFLSLFHTYTHTRQFSAASSLLELHERAQPPRAPLRNTTLHAKPFTETLAPLRLHGRAV